MIVMCTEYGSNYSGIAAITVPIMKMYCERHGYQFRELILEGTGNEYAYKKIEFFNELFEDENVDAIFYLDADALPTNHTIKIQKFIDDEHDLFITEHLMELNGGSLIIKNTKLGRLMNSSILALKKKLENEQNAVQYLRDTTLFRERMKILPHPSINSFNYELYPECPDIRKREQGHWHKKDFIFHAPGLSISKREEVLNNIKEHIVYE